MLLGNVVKKKGPSEIHLFISFKAYLDKPKINVFLKNKILSSERHILSI